MHKRINSHFDNIQLKNEESTFGSVAYIIIITNLDAEGSLTADWIDGFPSRGVSGEHPEIALSRHKFSKSAALFVTRKLLI